MAQEVRIVPDTSVIINGKLLGILETEMPKWCEIIVPVAVVDELQAQASKGRESGFRGLEELKKIRDLAAQRGYALRFAGERPTLEDIKLARSGRIDAMIRDVAKSENAVLYTSDYVQALVAEAEGVKIRYIEAYEKKPRLLLEDYFTDDAASLHLKVNLPPMVVRGRPGRFHLTRLRDEPCTEDEINAIVNEAIEEARTGREGYLEQVKGNAMTIRVGPYRLTVARPPLSDALELTATRPLVRLALGDYKLSGRLVERLSKEAMGILIVGPRRSGKTTFAGALAQFYVEQGKIVKTFEFPRELQVPYEVTRYAPVEGDIERTLELIYLTRPDYVIFDEMRRSRDLQFFIDARSAGIGVIGVVYSADPAGGLQKFLGLVEIGSVPTVVDTVIFMKDGWVEGAYEVRTVLKTPIGLGRPGETLPVIELKELVSGRLEYELFVYRGSSIVFPVGRRT